MVHGSWSIEHPEAALDLLSPGSVNSDGPQGPQEEGGGLG